MRQRPLPFIQHLAGLSADAKLERTGAAMSDLMRHDGAQLLFAVLGDMEHTALTLLRSGDAEQIHRISTIEIIRHRLLQLLPHEAPAWAEPEEEYESDEIYGPSPFDITPPSSDALLSVADDLKPTDE